jgi:hypothetical protein
MELLPKKPSTKGPAETFTGDVWFDVIARGEEPSRIRVNVVRFSPCARTAWHTHARRQTLHVTEGVGQGSSRSRARGMSARLPGEGRSQSGGRSYPWLTVTTTFPRARPSAMCWTAAAVSSSG